MKKVAQKSQVARTGFKRSLRVAGVFVLLTAGLVLLLQTRNLKGRKGHLALLKAMRPQRTRIKRFVRPCRLQSLLLLRPPTPMA